MHWLTSFTEATYLLARFHSPTLTGWLRGRRWERWAASALGSVAWTHQGPGHLRLFGRGGASGFRHEVDAAGARNDGTVLLEAKAYTSVGPSKGDVCLFDRKTFDLYVERRRRGERGPHWRVLASATGLDDRVRKYCYLYGIIAVEPARVPLPVLLRAAGRASADEFFSDMLLGEIVRLGELAVAPMESRYVPDGRESLRFDLRSFDRRALDDLLWLHATMSEEFLELIDRERPGHFELRAEMLLDRLGLPASVVSPNEALSNDETFGQVLDAQVANPGVV